MSLCQLEGFEYVCHVCFQDESADDDFVEDKVDLVHVEDEVELADVFKAAVECFDKDLYEVEDAELGLGAVDAEDEEEGCVVSVDDADVGAEDGGAAVEEVAQAVGAPRQQRKGVAYELLLPIFGCVLVKLCQARLAVVVQDDNRLDHRVADERGERDIYICIYI
jgi:hypothetical protein